LALAILISAYLLIDFTHYPLTGNNVASKMNERNVIAFKDIQGSRVYVAYEDNAYYVYMFGTGLLTGRISI